MLGPFERAPLMRDCSARVSVVLVPMGGLAAGLDFFFLGMRTLVLLTLVILGGGRLGVGRGLGLCGW